MKLSNKAFTVVETMIVVGIISTVASVALPGLLRTKANANESSAQAALKSIATALENYVAINSEYPTSENTLISEVPPYLHVDYFNGTHGGYNFSATLTEYTYSITAQPASANEGTSTYTITTGGVLTASAN